MADNLLKLFTSSKQYPVGSLRDLGLKTLVQLRGGPNRRLLLELKREKFEIFNWDDICKEVKLRTKSEDYDNLFWGAYIGYSPIKRNLYEDDANLSYFKFENEWKLAIKSSKLLHLARVNTRENPTVYEEFGPVCCYYADIEAASR